MKNYARAAKAAQTRLLNHKQRIAEAYAAQYQLCLFDDDRPNANNFGLFDIPPDFSKKNMNRIFGRDRDRVLYNEYQYFKHL